MKRKDALWVMRMCRDRDARSEAEREAFDTAIEALKSESIFTADRQRGEWVTEEGYGDLWVCDQCGFANEHNYSFCPICGAMMIGGEDE